MDIQTFISFAEELRHIAVAEARHCIPDAEDVEDVAQETMLRLWERRNDLTPELTKLHKYTTKVARNICLDKHRTRRRHPIFQLLWHNNKEKEKEKEEEYDIPSYDSPQIKLEASETMSIYQSAISKLPYNWRIILTMRGEKDMEYSEIAQILGTTESSVRGTLCKAKKKIIELIKKEIR